MLCCHLCIDDGHDADNGDDDSITSKKVCQLQINQLEVGNVYILRKSRHLKVFILNVHVSVSDKEIMTGRGLF